jgi:hypothetical protein
MLKAGTEYILISDNDMVVPRKWWRFVKTVFERHPEICSIGPFLEGKTVDGQQRRQYLMRTETIVIEEDGTPVISEYIPTNNMQIPQLSSGVWKANGVCDGFLVYKADLWRNKPFDSYGMQEGFINAVVGIVVDHNENIQIDVKTALKKDMNSVLLDLQDLLKRYQKQLEA